MEDSTELIRVSKLFKVFRTMFSFKEQQITYQFISQ